MASGSSMQWHVPVGARAAGPARQQQHIFFAGIRVSLGCFHLATGILSVCLDLHLGHVPT